MLKNAETPPKHIFDFWFGNKRVYLTIENSLQTTKGGKNEKTNFFAFCLSVPFTVTFVGCGRRATEENHQDAKTQNSKECESNFY
jgi:hypothetical protein